MKMVPVIDGLQINSWDRKTFEELREGNVIAVRVACCVWESAGDALRELSKWNRFFAANSDIIIRGRSVADIEFAEANNLTAIIQGFQNICPIENDIDLFEIYHQLGIRVVQLMYNWQNVAGSGWAERSDAGLSRFGRHVISVLNELGILIDLSHCGDQTAQEAIDSSNAPVSMTHANPRSFLDSRRNKPDSLLKQLAAAGGVLGMSLYPNHIRNGTDCTLPEFCDAVARSVDLMGIDHVAIGSDLVLNWPDRYLVELRYGPGGLSSEKDELKGNMWTEWPKWFSRSSDFPNLMAGLRTSGFGANEIDHIMWRNWKNLLSKVIG